MFRGDLAQKAVMHSIPKNKNPEIKLLMKFNLPTGKSSESPLKFYFTMRDTIKLIIGPN